MANLIFSVALSVLHARVRRHLRGAVLLCETSLHGGCIWEQGGTMRDVEQSCPSCIDDEVHYIGTHLLTAAVDALKMTVEWVSQEAAAELGAIFRFGQHGIHPDIA